MSLLLTPVQAQSDDVTLILNRNSAVTTLYLRAPSQLLVDRVGLTSLESQTGATFSEGQRMARAAVAELTDILRIRTDQRDLKVTPYLGILHRADDPLRVATPFEASISTAFCLTPDRHLPPLTDLNLYSAISVALPFDLGEMSLHLPRDMRNGIDVTLRIFEQGTFIEEQSITVHADTPIVVSRSPDTGSPWWLMGAILLVAAAAAFVATALRTRRHAALDA